MHFTTFIRALSLLFLSSLLTLVNAKPIALNLEARDVWTPPITDPNNGTVWIVGEKRIVTWDTSNPPKPISNQFGGRIQLRKGGFITPAILADNFDLLLGQIEVTVPWVEDGDDYHLVLFGDSGNWSQFFTIHS